MEIKISPVRAKQGAERVAQFVQKREHVSTNTYENLLGFIPKHKQGAPWGGVLGRIDNSEHFINELI